MKTLKQLLFAVAVMICFSMTASAQKEGDKKPPPKPKDPPVIVVEPKTPKPKDDKPKDDKKKPQAFILYFKTE
ncbi:MAG: hypothetical protein M3R14_08395 [Acidobacteriota bacterium]|nr:hypothetical protein [Acidobacteriota bacterium]